MARKKTFGTRTQLSTFGADLGSIIRFDSNNFNSISFSFILDKILQLIETPIANPIIHSLSSPDFSNSFEIFHYNLVSIKTGNNFLADVMINPSHKPSFSARDFFKQSSGTSCAFSLKFTSQELEFPFNLLDFRGFEEFIVRSDSKILYAEVNAKNSMRTRDFDINLFSKSEHEKTSAFLINPQQTLANLPSEVLDVTIRNIDIKLLSSFNCGNAKNFIFEGSRARKVISHRNIFNVWFCFGSFNHPASLFNTSNRKLSSQSFFTQRNIDKWVQFNIIPNLSLPSLIDTELQSFGINPKSSNYLFSWLNPNLNCCSSPHCIKSNIQDYLNISEGSIPPLTKVSGILEQI